jgi:hypothetical protein
MPSPPPIDLDALSLDDLKRLVVELLARVTAQDEEIRTLRDELAQAKKVGPLLANSGRPSRRRAARHGQMPGSCSG